MFLKVWDVRLEISVVSTHVNLNGQSVQVKNGEIENWSEHQFGMTDLNKTMRKMCGLKESKR